MKERLVGRLRYPIIASAFLMLMTPFAYANGGFSVHTGGDGYYGQRDLIPRLGGSVRHQTILPYNHFRGPDYSSHSYPRGHYSSPIYGGYSNPRGYYYGQPRQYFHGYRHGYQHGYHDGYHQGHDHNSSDGRHGLNHRRNMN